MKTHNGSVRTLSNVRDVPNLKRNLISLGIVESTRCNYSTEGGVLRDSKGTQTLLNALRYGRLYVLYGSTMIGSLIACTSTPNNIFTHVCHMWSDNMRKQDLCKSSSIAKFKHPLNLSGGMFT